ncbi:MAG: DUF2062 domain-containing protein [Xanthomonadales bacterium]|nr:DUF2062 domain-containing protein [Xanthomonadales bacterium]
MNHELERHRLEQLSRKRRIRRLLRPLPRRANIRRYPIIKWFQDAARKAPFLWSFKRAYVLRALYVGSILAFLPLYGFQFLLAFALALAFRANLTLTVALQFITNPFTILPIFGFTLWLGVTLMDAVGIGGHLGPAFKAANALFVGGFVTGLGIAVLLDIGYRILHWEAQRFSAQGRRLRELLHLPARHPEPDPAPSATPAEAGSDPTAQP